MDKLLANLKARFPEFSEEDIYFSVETMIEAMTAQLVRGGRIELRGFGSFILNTQRPGRSVSSFVVDDDVRLPEIPLVSFKPGLIIRKKLHHMRYSD